MDKKRGRVTIPTDMDVVKETIEIMDVWAVSQSQCGRSPSQVGY